MSNGNLDQLFQQLTQRRQQKTQQQRLSQQLGGVSNAIVEFFVQKEQRADEAAKDKLKRTQRLEDLTDEFELKDRLSVLKNRRVIDREATQNRRTDLRNLELDARNVKEFEAKRKKEKIEQGERQKELKLKEQKASRTKGPTASQSEAATFANRISQAEQIFNNLKAAGFDPTTKVTAVQRELPEAFKKQLLKQQEQAERNFVNAVLRRESGAAIAPSEFASAEKQYFPRVGDGPKVLEQKRLNRKIVFDGLSAESQGRLPKLLTFPKTIAEAQKQLEEKVGQLEGQTAPGQSRLSPEKQLRKQELLRKRNVR